MNDLVGIVMLLTAGRRECQLHEDHPCSFRLSRTALMGDRAALGSTDDQRPLAMSAAVVKHWSKQLKSYAKVRSIATLL